MEFLKIDIDKPLKHLSAGNFISDSDEWIHPKRNIDSFVLIFGLSDTLYIQQENEQYKVAPNNALILLPDKTHFGYKKSNKNLSYYWCHFYCEGNYSIINQKELINDVSFLNESNYSNHVYIPIFTEFGNSDRIMILYNQLLHAVNFPSYTQYKADYILTSLIIEISEQSAIKYYEYLNNTTEGSKFMRILEWIRINLDKNITVNQIADNFCYNPDYLSRMFKSKTGMNLTEYVHNLKLNRIKSLLTNSEMSIKEIAYNLGFEDEKYMMKLFKKHENLTPTQYRNAYCSTHLNNK